MDNNILSKLIEDHGASLYDTETITENDKQIFRVYISKKDGITLDECAILTKIISPILDLDPPISGKYSLEVSSPGIERRLRTIKHFENSLQEMVKIKIDKNEESIKLKGKILKVDKNNITLLVKKEEMILDFKDILKAKTYFQW